LEPGFTASIDWSTGWRLPSAGDNPQPGYNQTTSEMGHLYYVSLGKSAGGFLGDTRPFEELQADSYWSGTEYYPFSSDAWLFLFREGSQYIVEKFGIRDALAVHPGEVTAVPIPAAVWLLGSGMIGLVCIRRKLFK
jgi:hypothetical protein